MAIRFRRRIKIAPGVHINVGKKGISTSIGVRGASITTGKTGTRVTTGIPGTGLSSTHLIKKSKTNQAKTNTKPEPATPAEMSDNARLIAGLICFTLAFVFSDWLSWAFGIAGAYFIARVFIKVTDTEKDKTKPDES